MCYYVYMLDVSSLRNPPVHSSMAYESGAPVARLSDGTVIDFRVSRYFTRGWRLQELIAPFKSVFTAVFRSYWETRCQSGIALMQMSHWDKTMIR